MLRSVMRTLFLLVITALVLSCSFMLPRPSEASVTSTPTLEVFVDINLYDLMRSNDSIVVASDITSFEGIENEGFIYVEATFDEMLQNLPHEAIWIDLVCGDYEEFAPFEVSAQDFQLFEILVDMCRDKDYYYMFYIYPPKIPESMPNEVQL